MTNNKLNWQRLQVAMNNFKINRLMSYTDIKNKLKLALKNADQKGQNYGYAKKISQMINALGTHDDFIKDNKHNQKLFSDMHQNMKHLVGYAKVEDPITTKLNQLFKQAVRKEPKTMKQFNLRAHQQSHLSAQQAMLQAMGMEVKAAKNKK